MYYVNKIIGWITSPFGVFFLGMLLCGVLRVAGMRKGESSRKWIVSYRCLLGFLLTFLWFMGCGITTRVIGLVLESEWGISGRQHGSIDGLPDADAIVVLGGGMGVHAKCKAPEMFSFADRVWQGARLYKAGKAKVVTLSGPDVENSTVPLMMDLGVPKEVMLYFSGARNTEEEARLIYVKLHEVVKERKPKILLVTSAWHMSRSKLLFARVGFDVIPAPTDFEMSYVIEMPVRINDFLPSHEAFLRNSYALKELVANVGYRLLRR